MNGTKTQRRKAEGGRRRLGYPYAAPRSALRAPRSSRGISLTEVLIAMGVLTIGLLGVAALFPVGGYYMQKAEIADTATAVAQSALADAVARGMLNPAEWYTAATRPTGSVFLPGDGTEADLLARNVARAIAEDSAITATSTAELRKRMCRRLGSAFVIDPMGIAAVAAPNATAQVRPRADAECYAVPATANLTMFGHNAWRTWGTSMDYTSWPIRRVTFARPDHDPSTPEDGLTWLRASMASDLFSSHDDLALDMPNRADLPSMQRFEPWDFGGSLGIAPIARQWRGDYSWIVTVAPATNEARDALAYSGGGQQYNVSVVVFYKRPISRTDSTATTRSQIDQTGIEFWRSERTVRARVLSTGLSGGQLVLEGTADGVTESPFAGLKVGQWVMLCGPHPASTDTNPRFVLQWYRVVAIEGENEHLKADGTPGAPVSDPERRLVSLRGPEWSWEPASDLTNDDADVAETLSNWLCVGIFPGAVAVHTRTIRLEGNSPWSLK